MTEEFTGWRVGFTESGDRYTASQEKWKEYHQAWADGDMDLVMHFETGEDPEFKYTP